MALFRLDTVKDCVSGPYFFGMSIGNASYVGDGVLDVPQMPFLSPNGEGVSGDSLRCREMSVPLTEGTGSR
jgi:hypothetical protein